MYSFFVFVFYESAHLSRQFSHLADPTFVSHPRTSQLLYGTILLLSVCVCIYIKTHTHTQYISILLSFFLVNVFFAHHTPKTAEGSRTVEINTFRPAPLGSAAASPFFFVLLFHFVSRFSLIFPHFWNTIIISLTSVIKNKYILSNLVF